MYQHLSSMLFGAIDSAENENHEREICEKEDDEWILVDYIDACTNCSGEDASGMGLESFPDSAIFSSSSTSSIELLGNCSEPCFLQLASRPLEESWFITPPPCFTAGGLAPIHVETSPLENLLIEHPSMSVYVAHNRNNARESSRSVEYETEAVRTAPPAGLDHHIRCYAATLAAHTDLVQQAAQLRHVQRGKEHCAKHLVNRNNIRRQNLNREYISRQTKHSGHALHQPCQRQYNY